MPQNGGKDKEVSQENPIDISEIPKKQNVKQTFPVGESIGYDKSLKLVKDKLLGLMETISTQAF